MNGHTARLTLPCLGIIRTGTVGMSHPAHFCQDPKRTAQATANPCPAQAQPAPFPVFRKFPCGSSENRILRARRRVPWPANRQIVKGAPAPRPALTPGNPSDSRQL
jgi:hypothetical protein